MTLSLDFASIAAKIDDETLILTPNARTKQALEAGRMQEVAAGDVIRGLKLYSFSQWQHSLWQQLSFVQLLPIPIDNHAIKFWLVQLIEKEDAWVLTNPQGVADQVFSAYQNLCHWRLSLKQLNAGDSTEIKFFIQWIQKLEDFFHKNNLTAEFKQIEFLLSHWDLIKALIPQKILLVGFNHLTPLEECLLNQLQLDGTLLEYYNPSKSNRVQQQLVFDDLKGELAFAAQYANQWLSQQASDNLSHQSSQFGQSDLSAQPSHSSPKSIAIVVDQLSHNLNRVHEAFSQVFHAEEEKPWLPLSKPSYNVSAGQPLLDQPIVNAALQLLKINPKRISFEQLQLLKNTPFIIWGNEKNSIRHFIHQQVLKGKAEYDLASLNYHAQDFFQSEKQYQPLESLLNLLTELADLNKSTTMLQHIHQWKAFLLSAGFFDSNNPQHPLDLFQNQALESLLKTMQQCEIIDYLNNGLSLNRALDYLQQACREQAFQVASDRSQVQVLGILEASGLEFDQVLLVGFGQMSWPQKNKINPFLPLHLQREHKMPGSSAEREYHYAKKLSNSLIQSSQQLVATASYDESKTQSDISGLFAHFDKIEASQLISDDDSKQASNINLTITSERFKWISNDALDIPMSEIRGGAYLLSDYAKCPFQAMLKYQFRSKDYQAESKGLDPREKGSWLHAVMQHIWQQIKTQKCLNTFSDQQLTELVEKSVLRILNQEYKSIKQRLGDTLTQMEADKLIQRILQWLAIEKTREEFSIKHLEQPMSLDLGPFSLHFKIDRVDSNSQGQIEIIDYKTGQCHLSSWFSVRPTEAQMPAYYLAANLSQEQTIASLQYAKLKTGDIGRLGLQVMDEQLVKLEDGEKRKDKNYFSKLELSSADDLAEQWKASLGRLAQGIAEGYFPVSPKDIQSHCQYCDYGSVCRIKEEQTDVE